MIKRCRTWYVVASRRCRHHLDVRKHVFCCCTQHTQNNSCESRATPLGFPRPGGGVTHARPTQQSFRCPREKITAADTLPSASGGRGEAGALPGDGLLSISSVDRRRSQAHRITRVVRQHTSRGDFRSHVSPHQGGSITDNENGWRSMDASMSVSRFCTLPSFAEKKKKIRSEF